MNELDPSKKGIPMQSKFDPDVTNYLRYYYIENISSELNTKFGKTIMSLDGIGTVTSVDADVLENIVYKSGINYDHFCGHMNSKYLFSSAGVKIPKNKLITGEVYDKTEFNALFIISGTSDNNYLLHSVITFNVSLYPKDTKTKILTIDAFCAYQKYNKDDRGVDNPGGRLLFDVINRACKKMKIKQINLEALEEAKPWYKSKGFIINVLKSDSDHLSKPISFSPEVEADEIVLEIKDDKNKKEETKEKTKSKEKKDSKENTTKKTKAKTQKTKQPTATIPWWRRIFSRRR